MKWKTGIPNYKYRLKFYCSRYCVQIAFLPIWKYNISEDTYSISIDANLAYFIYLLRKYILYRNKGAIDINQEAWH